MIAIVCAMTRETEELRAAMKDVHELSRDGHVYYSGRLAQEEVVIVESGIGGVAAGVLLARLVSLFPAVDQVLNIGVAGGIPGKVRHGEVVIASETAFFDADMTAWGLPRGAIQGLPFPFAADPLLLARARAVGGAQEGLILSGDTFFTDKDTVMGVIAKHFAAYPVLALDMESAAFHEASWLLGRSFLSIRAISDVLGESAQVTNYEERLDEAVRASSAFALALLSRA